MSDRHNAYMLLRACFSHEVGSCISTAGLQKMEILADELFPIRNPSNAKHSQLVPTIRANLPFCIIVELL